MDLTKSNQNLRRDLKEIAALLKLSGVDLMQAAVKLSGSDQEAEAKEVLKIAADFHEVEDRLAEYAEEVKAGKIVRDRAEPAKSIL
jgi:hypothetical protein